MFLLALLLKGMRKLRLNNVSLTKKNHCRHLSYRPVCLVVARKHYKA